MSSNTVPRSCLHLPAWIGRQTWRISWFLYCCQFSPFRDWISFASIGRTKPHGHSDSNRLSSGTGSQDLRTTTSRRVDMYSQRKRWSRFAWQNPLFVFGEVAVAKITQAGRRKVGTPGCQGSTKRRKCPATRLRLPKRIEYLAGAVLTGSFLTRI
jgi:hypothetical protein